MKILHVSTSEQTGGAARAAHRLHTALQQETNCDSKMYVRQKQSDDAKIIQYIPNPTFRNRVLWRWHKHKIERTYKPFRQARPKPLFEIFSDERTRFGYAPVDDMPHADIINLHWIVDFIDYSRFFEKIRAPIVWTLHDMHPLTGGCHYDNKCGKFASHCAACPQLGSDLEHDPSYWAWERRKSMFEMLPPDQLHFVTPSKWLANQVRQSPFAKRFITHVIPNSVDTETYRPHAREAVRSILDIPSDKFVLLWVAHVTSTARKGYSLLIDALNEFQDLSNFYLVSIGAGRPRSLPTHIPHQHLNTIKNDKLLAAIYSMADLFIIPSIQDNLPNTMLEAMACGTPVVGFNVGGIPDSVITMKTGALTEENTSRGLAKTIHYLFNEQTKLPKMRENCRRQAITEYSMKVQAERYNNLYESIYDSKKIK